MSAPARDVGDRDTLSDRGTSDTRLEHVPPFVKNLSNGSSDPDVVAHVGSAVVVEGLRADPVVGGDDSRHMARFASVAKGARILEVATSGEQRSDVAGGAPMKKVNRPAVTKPTGRTFPNARGAG